jgi:hypothetical protein
MAQSSKNVLRGSTLLNYSYTKCESKSFNFNTFYVVNCMSNSYSYIGALYLNLRKRKCFPMKIACVCSSIALLKWQILYRNTMLDTVHCLGYMWYTRRFISTPIFRWLLAVTIFRFYLFLTVNTHNYSFCFYTSTLHVYTHRISTCFESIDSSSGNA